jgi:single-strand DNA-binding protein
VVAFGKLGEICASYCLKGRRVYIEGRLRTREYDGSDGLRRHTTEIVAETMKLLDRPRTEDSTPHDEETGEPAVEATAPDAHAGGTNGEHTGKRNKVVAAPG